MLMFQILRDSLVGSTWHEEEEEEEEEQIGFWLFFFFFFFFLFVKGVWSTRSTWKHRLVEFIKFRAGNGRRLRDTRRRRTQRLAIQARVRRGRPCTTATATFWSFSAFFFWFVRSFVCLLLSFFFLRLIWRVIIIMIIIWFRIGDVFVRYVFFFDLLVVRKERKEQKHPGSGNTKIIK